VGEEWLCPACGTIQPLSDSVDEFACLGFPRHLQLDAQLVTERFHERSRQIHPDFFQTKSDRERALSLEASSWLNRAYRVLRDPIERIQALIRLETGERETTAKAPSDLVEEVFELQETLERARERREESAVHEQLRKEQERWHQRLARVDEELRELSARWDRAIDHGDDVVKRELVAALRDRLSGRQYLVNTIEDITMTLEGRSDAKDRRH
jgi:molecular chaperone HscB